MQGYAQEICRTRFFVGLKIEVDAPGVLAAIRPCDNICSGWFRTERGKSGYSNREIQIYIYLDFLLDDSYKG